MAVDSGSDGGGMRDQDSALSAARDVQPESISIVAAFIAAEYARAESVYWAISDLISCSERESESRGQSIRSTCSWPKS